MVVWTMYTLVCRWIGAAALATTVSFAVVGAFTAASIAQEELPVWWSPSLELESLDQIDTILNGLYPEEDQVVVRKFVREGNARLRLREVVQDCRTHIRLIEDGYEFTFPWEALDSKRRYGDECFALDALSRAKPAASSFLSDFELNGEALSVLPPFFRPVGGCGYLRAAWLANRDGVSWAEFWHRDPYYAVTGVRTLSETEIQIDAEHWSTHVELYGRGDFDGDGWEDLLMRTIDRFRDGFDGSHLFLLVRDGPASNLRIVWEYGVYASKESGCKRLGFIFEIPDEKPRRGAVR